MSSSSGLVEVQVSSLPDFSALAGMESLKAQLKVSLIEPLRNPQLFEQLGLSAGDKYLLYGPPGCGKSFAARAVAGEAKASYFELTPATVFGQGDAVGIVSRLFEAARYKVPSVIVIDEVETLTENRDAYADSAYIRTFLNEMLIQTDDTTSNNDRILVMGSTNAPWYIDGAFMRNGRFGHVVFVPPPDFAARLELLRKLTIGDQVSPHALEQAAHLCLGYSFADIAGSVRKARQSALKLLLMEGRKIEAANECRINDRLLIEASQHQFSSVTDWFKRFEKHSPQLHKALVDPVRQYLIEKRKLGDAA